MMHSKYGSNDQDVSDTHSYTLVAGEGDTDNAFFSIDGNQLKINSSPDYETKSSYSIRLKTKDSGGLSYEKSINLSVNDIMEPIEAVVFPMKNQLI